MCGDIKYYPTTKKKRKQSVCCDINYYPTTKKEGKQSVCGDINYYPTTKKKGKQSVWGDINCQASSPPVRCSTWQQKPRPSCHRGENLFSINFLKPKKLQRCRDVCWQRRKINNQCSVIQIVSLVAVPEASDEMPPRRGSEPTSF